MVHEVALIIWVASRKSLGSVTHIIALLGGSNDDLHFLIQIQKKTKYPKDDVENHTNNHGWGRAWSLVIWPEDELLSLTNPFSTTTTPQKMTVENEDIECKRENVMVEMTGVFSDPHLHHTPVMMWWWDTNTNWTTVEVCIRDKNILLLSHSLTWSVMSSKLTLFLNLAFFINSFTFSAYTQQQYPTSGHYLVLEHSWST